MPEIQLTEQQRRGTRIAHIGLAVRAIDELLPFLRDVLLMPEVPLDDADGASIAGVSQVANRSLNFSRGSRMTRQLESLSRNAVPVSITFASPWTTWTTC